MTLVTADCQVKYESIYNVWMEKDGWNKNYFTGKDAIHYTNVGNGKVALGWLINSANKRYGYRWMIISEPANFSLTDTTIMNKAHEYFVAEIVANGVCVH